MYAYAFAGESVREDSEREDLGGVEVRRRLGEMFRYINGVDLEGLDWEDVKGMYCKWSDGWIKWMGR